MTKEITKANILQQIQDKFKLRELTPEIFRFSEQVVPIYDIETHLQQWTIDYHEESITATGAFVFFEVPYNERWIFSRYDVVFMGTPGAITIAGVYITRAEKPTYGIYLDLTAGQSTSYHVGLHIPVVLNAGDKVRVNVDGYTSTQALRVFLDYQVEELR